jgi:flagellar secretion chaperone FliS
MGTAQAIKAYTVSSQESLIHGSSGAQLVVMLYDGVIDAVTAAADLCGNTHDFAPFGRQVGRAITILAGLRETLDFDGGQPVAGYLLDFYNAITSKILLAQQKRDRGMFLDCARLVSDVRDSWVKLSTVN